MPNLRKLGEWLGEMVVALLISFTILFLVLVWLGFSQGEAWVTIRNDSGTTLSNVVLSGDGVLLKIRAIRPGRKITKKVPGSKSINLTLEFDAAGRRHSHPQAIPIERLSGYGYETTVVVTKDFALKQ